jgi:hypothetical protein
VLQVPSFFTFFYKMYTKQYEFKHWDEETFL